MELANRSYIFFIPITLRVTLKSNIYYKIKNNNVKFIYFVLQIKYTKIDKKTNKTNKIQLVENKDIHMDFWT